MVEAACAWVELIDTFLWFMMVLNLYWEELDVFQSCLHFQSSSPSLHTRDICGPHLALQSDGWVGSPILPWLGLYALRMVLGSSQGLAPKYTGSTRSKHNTELCTVGSGLHFESPLSSKYCWMNKAMNVKQSAGASELCLYSSKLFSRYVAPEDSNLGYPAILRWYGQILAIEGGARYFTIWVNLLTSLNLSAYVWLSYLPQLPPKIVSHPGGVAGSLQAPNHSLFLCPKGSSMLNRFPPEMAPSHSPPWPAEG